MKKHIIQKAILLTVLGLAASCDKNDDITSKISSFETVPVVKVTNAIVAPEADEGAYTINFELPENQVTPLTVVVGVGNSSTATEGEDFEIETHEVELQAYEGQDGFDIVINVLEDYVDEDGDETVYLTLTSTTPSGIDETEVLAVTIQDSDDTTPPPSDDVALTVSWEFDGGSADPCDIDIDVTIQETGVANPYDVNDLLLYATSTAKCIEKGTFHLSDMEDGMVYNVFVLFYGTGDDYGALSAMTVTLDFAREFSDFNVTTEVEGEFDSTMEDHGIIAYTLERNGDVLTLKKDAAVIGQGRFGGYDLSAKPAR